MKIIWNKNQCFCIENYYPSAMYQRLFGIIPPFDVPYNNFMAYQIRPKAPDIYGVLKYAKELDIG